MKKIAKRILRKVLTKKPSFSKILQHKPSLNFAKNNSLCAFSLIELSVVIIIISFLAASALSLFSGSVVNTKFQITNTKIQSVYQALQNYVSANGVLPCPAPLTDIKSTSTTYGQSTSSCSTLTASGNGVYVSSNLIYGMVPVRAINLNNDMAEDGFGNKLVYVIDKTFTSKTATTSPFSDSNKIATLNVKKYISSSSTEEANAVFAIISHGANQKGAFPANSSAQILASSDFGESDNNSASPDLSVTYSSNSSAFDDVVLFKNKANLLLDSKSTSLQSSNLASNSVAAPIVCSIPSNTKIGVVGGQTVSQGSGYLPCDQSGYTGSIGFTCAGTSLTLSSTDSCGCASSYIPSSGSCLWQCSISSVAGVSNQMVNEGTGTLPCNSGNFNPSYNLSYTCARGVLAPTINTACTNCASGYNYSNGVCSPISCTVTSPTSAGTTITSVSPGSGTITCDKPGYSGTVNYTCSGGTFTGGACSQLPACSCNNCTTDTTSVAGQVIHKFTSDDTLTCTRIVTPQILVVGGGGSGGTGNAPGGGGGGGGGGVVYANSYPIIVNTQYNVIVGAGGVSAIFQNQTSPNGNNGGNSSFGTITAFGGGGGGHWNNSTTINAKNGGSGGGAGGGFGGTGGTKTQVTQTNATNFHGNNGGSSVSDGNFCAAGGGGAGEAGNINTSSSGGNGGAGTLYSITGTQVYYGAGGGGSSGNRNTFGGNGGSGVGGNGSTGNGSNYTLTATNGSSLNGNAGNGGGGANAGNNHPLGNSSVSGAGSPGIVIIRYSK